ncbi:hypothetical protein HAX54_017910, partial [Datura stramonium]|nr:hypothetical protein [Datura stramonium]
WIRLVCVGGHAVGVEQPLELDFWIPNTRECFPELRVELRVDRRRVEDDPRDGQSVRLMIYFRVFIFVLIGGVILLFGSSYMSQVLTVRFIEVPEVELSSNEYVVVSSTLFGDIFHDFVYILGRWGPVVGIMYAPIRSGTRCSHLPRVGM